MFPEIQSMEFLHDRLYLGPDDEVEIDCDIQANVMLTDDINFQNFRNGRSYTYYGGFFTHFPARLRPPHSGYWNVTLDLGGAKGTIEYSFTVVRRK